MKITEKELFSSNHMQICLSCENFHPDGCSGGLSYFWKKIFKKDCPYNPYCIDHDCRYFLGTQSFEGILGEIYERFRSDWILASNIWNHDKNWFDKPMAIIVFLAVRIGGSRIWIFNSFQWQYGVKKGMNILNEADLIKHMSKKIKDKFD